MILIEIKLILKFESFEYSKHFSNIVSRLSRTEDEFHERRSRFSSSNFSI